MANTQILKRRIGTAKNIRQITKAMEMVSASKMRRAQQQALSTRPYSTALQRTLLTIAAMIDPTSHPLLRSHSSGKHIFVLVSTDKSLAGSLNTNLFRGLYDHLESNGIESPAFIIIGQKARRFVLANGYELYAEYSNFPDPVSQHDTDPISHMIIKSFLKQEFRSVNLVYMDFISTLVQKMRIVPILPFPKDWSSLFPNPDDIVEAGEAQSKEYFFEPGAKQILDWLLPYFIDQIVYHTLLEAKASEHSARMVAMKNASDNAGEIITDLTLQFNKQRQAKITTELLDNTTSAIIVTQ